MPPLGDPLDETSTSMVLVSGAGRSGTSTVAGVLKQLGYHVPQPEVELDESNPRGFFEPAWVVDFHKRLLRDIDVRTNDGRPDAGDVGARVSGDLGYQKELQTWLGEQQHQARNLVVKDPRTAWVLDLWFSVAHGLGIDSACVTMLRHPAQVIGSRAMHYLADLPPEVQQARQTTNAAGWINVNLVNELRTRAHARSFVRYDKLVEDWRGTMRVVSDQLGRPWPIDLSSPEAAAVDEFVDPTLHRAREAWDDVEIPAYLRDLAEELWNALGVLAEKPHDAEAIGRIDDVRASYHSLHAQAVAFTRHYTLSEVTTARRQLRTKLQRQHRKEMEQVRRETRQPTVHGDSGQERQVSGRDLTARGRRAVRRLLGKGPRRGS
jgi:hypothetical protein